jgi:hypothetical protein
VDAGIDLGDGVQQREGAEHVIRLGVDRVTAVDHRVRRGALLGVVHHGVRAEVTDHPVGEHRVAEVADVAADVLAGDFLPGGDANPERLDRDQALHAEVVVLVPAREVVGDSHLVTVLRQGQRRWPAQVPVSA